MRNYTQDEKENRTHAHTHTRSNVTATPLHNYLMIRICVLWQIQNGNKYTIYKLLYRFV